MKNLISLAIALSFTSLAPAQNVKLIKCNTPSVNVNGKEIHVGESFGPKSKINWKSASQVIIVRNSAGKLVRLAAKMSSNGKSDIIDVLLAKSTNHLSARAADDIAKGTFIIQDTLMIPTYLERTDGLKVEFKYDVDGKTVSTPVELTNAQDYVIIRENQIPGLKNRKVFGKLVGNDGEETFDVSEILEIVSVDVALSEE